MLLTITYEQYNVDCMVTVNPMSTDQIEGCNEILVGDNSIYLYNAVYFYLSFCFSSHRSAVLPLLMFSYAVNTVTCLILFHIDTHCQLLYAYSNTLSWYKLDIDLHLYHVWLPMAGLLYCAFTTITC